jgi:hypothetical protein
VKDMSDSIEKLENEILTVLDSKKEIHGMTSDLAAIFRWPTRVFDEVIRKLVEENKITVTETKGFKGYIWISRKQET